MGAVEGEMKKSSLIIPVVVIAVLLPLSFFLFDKRDVVAHEHSNSIHWHQNLSIIIDGKKIEIPNGLGITKGNLLDAGKNDMQMSPLHTHDISGKIHLEGSASNHMDLGYFFSIWGKAFNQSCILNYCTDKGSLKMYVNGKENFEFERYVLQNEDQILLTFESFQGGNGNA